MTSERLIRLIIRLYPVAYRTEHQEEILSTVRDSLSSLRRGGAALELADLAGQAFRERVRLTATSMAGAVLATAAPLAAGSAIALSLVFLVFAELSREPIQSVGWRTFGPFATLGPIAYLAWMMVFLVAVAGRDRTARLMTGTATALSVVIVPLAWFTGMQRPLGYVPAALVLFGVIVLAAPVDPMRRSPLERRPLTAWMVLFTGVLSIIVLDYGLAERTLVAPRFSLPRLLWYFGTDANAALGSLMPYALGLLLVVSVLCLWLNRRLFPAVIAVTFPWAVFAYGASERPSVLIVASLCAAGLAGLVLTLSVIDRRRRASARERAGLHTELADVREEPRG